MCGICGIVDFRHPFNINKNALIKMNQAMVHRGPDEGEIYVDKWVGLGSRRLSIIDLVTGSQPISNESQSMWIVFNGEIYNYRELRAYLVKRGHQFKTSTDTEVIIHLYEEFGVDCVQHLNGIFAFAIWDTLSREILLARDRMGVKPIYYYKVGDRFIFGSEMKVILAYPDIERDIDLISLNEYFSYEYVPSPRTIIKNVKRLEPGHVLRYNSAGIKDIRYWHISFSQSESRPPVNWRDYVIALKETLAESIKREMVSDVPVGILLSGGLDSSTVAAFMTKSSSDTVNSFSIGFEEDSFDESAYARRVARALGTKHHEMILTSKMASRIVPNIADFLDEPFADSSLIPTYLLSQFASQYVKVVMGGDGGDELFAGYPTLVAHQLIEYYERLVPWALRAYLVPRMLNLLPVSFRNISFDFRARRFLAGRGVPLIARHHRWLGSFTDEEKNILFQDWVKPVLRDTYAQASIHDRQCDAHHPLNRVLYADMKLYLEGDILYKVDRASMANSLEVRVPLLNPDVVTFACNLPFELKLHGLQSKFLLKKTVSNMLPSEVINRPKKGFNMPVAYWINGDLREVVLDMLSEDRIKRQGFFNTSYISDLLHDHFELKKDNRKLIWTLLIFQLWFDRYIER